MTSPDETASLTPYPACIPICGRCKKIRLPDGSWEILEQYLGRRFDIMFTHTLCPDDQNKSGRIPSPPTKPVD